jgi:fumarate reductase subunit D
MRREVTPILWLLFSAGGTIAAFLFPIHMLLTGVAFPLGWMEPPNHERALGLLSHPFVRLYFFGLIALPLWHWAHRFRYTLYDGLMLKHLTVPIVVFTYGSALAGTLAAAWALWTLP